MGITLGAVTFFFDFKKGTVDEYPELFTTGNSTSDTSEAWLQDQQNLIITTTTIKGIEIRK